MLTLFVVSGGTGKTARRVAQAVQVQFAEASIEIDVHENVRTQKQLRSIVQQAKTCDSMILHTLVSDKLRRLMLTEARQHGVDSVELLGPVMDRLAARLKLQPLGKPGLLAKTTEGETRQIEAVDYAFRHDDGQRVQELKRAEIVLVGVSRSMKTPTMLYLAYRGWFVANIPLVPEIEPPKELLALKPSRVFYLQMAASRLVELRRTRATKHQIPVEPYASPEQVRNELRHAQRLCARHGWQVVDVTGKSVEEVSREIILLASSGSSKKKAT